MLVTKLKHDRILPAQRWFTSKDGVGSGRNQLDRPSADAAACFFSKAAWLHRLRAANRDGLRQFVVFPLESSLENPVGSRLERF